MALPTWHSLKTLLRIETDAEDELLDDLMDRAEASVRLYLDRPIESEERTYYLGEERTRGGSVGKLVLPDAPVDPASVELSDGDATEIDETDYRVDANTGVLRGLLGFRFDVYPYAVTVEVGLEHHTDYETTIEPLISQAILDTAADLYQHRNPNATQESTLGVSVSYGDGCPPRVKAMLGMLRRPGVV